MEQFSGHPLFKRHTIDSVMGSMWEFYKKKFIPLFLVALVMSFITQFASSLIDFKELQSITDPEVMLTKIREYIWPMVLISVMNLLFFTILQYYVMYNPLNSDNNLLRSVIRALRYYIPYLILMVLFVFVASFILFLGILALIVGVFFAGLYVATVYFFILPVMMGEGPNIASTISRTMRLAHKRFWPNMGWTAVFILVIVVSSIILSGLVLLPFTGSFLKVISNPGDVTQAMDFVKNPLYLILSGVVSALIYPFYPIFSTILYFNGLAFEENQTGKELPESDDDKKIKVEDLYSAPPEKEDLKGPENQL
jgi:hypothetical protein